MDSDYGVEKRDLSDLQKLRSTYQPPLPPSLQGTSVRVEYGDATTATDPSEVDTTRQIFPHTYAQPLVRFLSDTPDLPSSSSSCPPPLRVGVVFCGRQSPGGHNVIWGIHDALKTHNPKSVLLGFLDGSEGLFAQRTLEVTDDILSTYKNQGGFDLLGRTKDQIRTNEQVNAALAACTSLKLDGLVIIGGVTSNTDAAQLAETFAEAKCPTKVVGVPVTLNGDLKNRFVETNVGFDTICKVNSQLISNVCIDALSAEKYYYFIRLMGRKASHVALECTLQSHPNMVILGEEVSASKLTLFDLTNQICDAVQDRAEQDKHHGVILLPEGLIESIPEVYALLQEIHRLHKQDVHVDKIFSQLSPPASAFFELLPSFIKKQLLLFPESDDSAQLSQIETEKLLAYLVEAEMNKRLKEGTYKGKKFNAICHFFGYQARGSLPSKFDCDYAFVLGHICYHILAAGLSGYLATVTNLKSPVSKWCCGAAPITAMMTVKRLGYGPVASSPGKPALHPAIVDLNGKIYELLRQNSKKFLMDDVYKNPGPLQFDGPSADSKAVTLCAEDQEYINYFKEDEVMVDKIEPEASPPLVLEVENCKSTAETAASTTSEGGYVLQCHEQEKVANSESPTVLELREGNNVPESDVLTDSNNSCPISKPEEVEVSVTKYPNRCHIEDATVQKDSSQEKVTNSESPTVMELEEGINVPEANVPADSENSSPTSQPKKEEASVTKDPIDCDIQDATIQKDLSENDNILSPLDDSMKAETEVDCQETTKEPLPAATSETGDVAQYHEQEKATNSEPLRVLKSREEDNVPEADVVADSKDSCPTSMTEGEEDSVTNDPIDCQIQDATVQKDPSENDNDLRSPDDYVKAETEVDNQEATMEVLPTASSETGHVPQSHEQEEAIISKSFTALESREEDNEPEADVVADSKVSCPTSIPEGEDASVIKDSNDCKIQDATVKKDSYEIENKFGSPDVSLKPGAEGDALLCSVDNAAGIEVEVTNALNKVNGIPKADKTSVLSCTDNTSEACSHSLATGVVIPAIVSCHVNGGLVYDVDRSNVADLISDSEIHNYSCTNGMNTSFTDVAVASQSQVQFGSFVPAVYQVNSGCRDDSNKMITCQEEVNGYEHVPRSNFSKPLPSFKAYPVVEESVAVESVERPFNFLIRMPRYYDDELDDQIRQAELQVAEKTQKREAFKLEMQKIREDVQQARSDYTEAVSEGRAARQLVKSKRQEIDSVQSVINRVKNAISVDDIDVRIKHMEHMMQHETLPLKEEKQFIREIKQLKHYREQLSANMGSQDEVREAIDQKGQIEEKLKTLRKDLDRLKKEVTTAEAKVAAADTKHKDEKKRLEKVYHQHIAAQSVRQEAYMNLQNLRKQFYEKNARFRTYKDDTTAANDYLSSGDKTALHRLCLNQVEEIMELWNKDEEFRKEYIRCNARSTIGRLRTMDGRALGPGEESPVVVGGRNKSSRDKVGQVDPELLLVSADLEKREEQVPAAQAAEATGGKSVEKVTGKTNKEEKGKKPGKLALMNGSPPVNSFVGISETLEEESNKKQMKEEEEVARREEQLRRAEEEAKLKEQRRLEEIAKAREALERKRKIAEKAQIRAEVRAQKEAEQKDKEKEKRAKKKERKKTGVGGASDSSFEGGDTIVPVSEVTSVTTAKEVETKEGYPSSTGTAAASKRPQKPYTKQQNKLKASSSIPPPLRNKNKRRMQQWMWATVMVAVVVAVIVLANLGLYPNNLGRNNRHPGF